MITTDKTFKDISITLDGGTFTRCKFERCKIVFSGILPVTLDDPAFVDCEWSFTGPAANAMNFMRAMFLAGAKDLIEKTCAGIQSPAGSTAPVIVPVSKQKPATKAARKSPSKIVAGGRPH